MKRLFLLASLVIVSCIGFNTATASAASCNYNVDHIFWDGSFGYRAILAGCQGVDQVQFGMSSSAGQSGIVVYTPAGYVMHPAFVGAAVYDNNCAGQCFNTYHVGRWCFTQAVVLAYGQFTYRIHSTSSHQYGPWHIGIPYYSEYILC